MNLSAAILCANAVYVVCIVALAVILISLIIAAFRSL